MYLSAPLFPAPTDNVDSFSHVTLASNDFLDDVD
jgi:hypothetical protein